MADYTIRLCDLIEREKYPLIENAMSNYEAPSQSVRDELNQYILRHFWLREIGMESPDVFAYYLDRALCEMMPLYNERREIDAMLLGLDPTMTYKEIVESARNEERNGTRKNTRTYDTETKNDRTYTDNTVVDTEHDTTYTDNTTVNTEHDTTYTDNTTVDGINSGTGKTTMSGSGSNSSTTDTTDSSTSSQEADTTNTNDGYVKRYDIPMTGGSSGVGPGGFGDDFASNGQVTHDNGVTHGTSSNTSGGTSKVVASGNDATESETDTTNSGTSKTTTTGTRTDNGTGKTTTTGNRTDNGTGKTTTTGNRTDNDVGTHTGTDTDDGTDSQTMTGSDKVTRSGTNTPVWRNIKEYREDLEDINTEIVNDKRLTRLFMDVAHLWSDMWCGGCCL